MDGICVGKAEGSAKEGAKLGVEGEGALVGAVEGDDVRASVGSLDGNSELGAIVVDVEGTIVGCALGELVEGIADGGVDGITVGETDGSIDGFTEDGFELVG